MFFLELLPFSVRHIHFRKVGRGGGHLQVLKKIYRPRVIFKVLGPPWLQHDFLADLNDVLTLPGYTKLRRLRLEILLWSEVMEDYDREESRRELNGATRAQCSQLFNRPSLDFSHLVALEGIDDDETFGYFYCESDF
jgi:hypothetical protein